MEYSFKEPLAIGRIGRKEEKALGISLTSSVLVYISEEDLNRMAYKRKDTYLSDLEEIKAIIKSPDYVLYKKDLDEFSFLKEYLRNHQFVKVQVKVAHLGTPKRWFLKSVGCPKMDDLLSDDARYGYAKLN